MSSVMNALLELNEKEITVGFIYDCLSSGNACF